MKKILGLIILVLIIGMSNVYSLWQRHDFPGRYIGLDPTSGGIICANVPNEVCYSIYLPVPDPPRGPTPGDARCLFVPNTNWGLTDIDGVVESTLPSGNTLYVPNKNANTTVVDSEQDVIDWMNLHY